MPTDNRATAERIAPFTLVDAERYVLRMGTTNEQDIADAVNDDRKHRNREAASKALGYIYGQLAARPVVDKDVALAVVLHAVQSKEGYLAAEFDAGERVTLSDGSVVELDPDGVELVRRNIARSIPRVAKREHWPLLVTELTGADFDAVKRLAEQRGAER